MHNRPSFHSQKAKGKANIKSMFEVMSRHYDQIKGNLGLDEALEPSSEDEQDDYIRKCTKLLR